MTISPITSVLPRSSNIQQTSFGKKEKKTNLPETRSSVISKAIPSAALVLASMSPGVNANTYSSSAANSNMFAIERAEYINNEDIKSSSGINFIDAANSGPVKVLLREGVTEPKDGSRYNTFQVIYFNDTDKSSGDNVVTRMTVGRGVSNPCKVKSLNKFHFEIIGDDGIAGRPIVIPYIAGENLTYGPRIDDFYSPALYNQVDKVLKGKDSRFDGYEGNIARENEYLKIRPSSNGDLQNVPSKTDWLSVGRRVKENFGEAFDDKFKVKTPTGNYTIRVYDKDGDTNNFETLTIQKDGEGEFKVAGVSVTRYNVMMAKDDYTEKTFVRGSIVLNKRNSNEKAVIVNDTLLKELLRIYRVNSFNNAYKNEAYDSNILLNDKKSLILPCDTEILEGAHPTESEFDVWKD